MNLVDELMHHVSKGWYWLHWIVMVLINVLLLGGYFLSRVSGSTEIQQTYGLNEAVLYLSGGMLIYMFTAYWLLARISLPLATFTGSLIMVLPLLNVLDQTNQSNSSWIYVLLWLSIAWLEGMYGISILIGTLLVTMIYLMLEIEFDPSNLQPISLVLLAGSVLVLVLGYLFWRNRFITPTSKRVSQLSGMLRSNKQQSEILIESIADGVIVTDTEGIVKLINEAGSKLTAWPIKEAVGFDAKAVLRLIDDPKTNKTIPDQEHPFNQVIAKHEPINQTVRLFNREDKIIFISLVISPVLLPKSDEFVGTVAVFRDVSKQKEEEQQRAEFISTASHEMRTPVAAIEGYLALAMNDQVSKIDTKAKEFLEKAHSSTQHLGKLFQDLLTSAKAEDGRLSSHPEVIEMGQYIHQLTEDLRFGAQKKGLDMEYVVNSSHDKDVIDASGGSMQKTIQPLYYVYADPDRIREVVTNLFDNAVKYTDKGKISIGMTGNDKVVQVRISDTGHGIPPEDLPHLFQKFYRVDNSQTRTVGGTGLGLFICRKIVELYNGHIWAESTIGKGSTFYINLPRISPQQVRHMQIKSEQTKQPEQTRQPQTK
jgi:PAS domain S-box-containing protein